VSSVLAEPGVGILVMHVRGVEEGDQNLDVEQGSHAPLATTPLGRRPPHARTLPSYEPYTPAVASGGSMKEYTARSYRARGLTSGA